MAGCTLTGAGQNFRVSQAEIQEVLRSLLLAKPQEGHQDSGKPSLGSCSASDAAKPQHKASGHSGEESWLCCITTFPLKYPLKTLKVVAAKGFGESLGTCQSEGESVSQRREISEWTSRLSSGPARKNN